VKGRHLSVAASWLQAVSAVADADVIQGAGVTGYAHDIFRARELPLAVLVPGTVQALQRMTRIVAEAGLAINVRGGGASYTDGYLPTRRESVLFDLRRLDRIVEINEEDAFVTVECGVTWDALKAVLDERGLRTPFRGPFSGLVATVGGTVAQHGISHGTGGYGGSAASVLSLDVVMADGELLSTGSAARGAAPVNRYFGPDITGLFTGDCGAFGIKARITLPLLRAGTQHATASFAFADFQSLRDGMLAAARAGADDTHFGMDANLVRGQLRRGRSLRETLDIAREVWRTSPSWLAAGRQLLRMGLAGERALRESAYMAHYIVEGADRYSVNAAMRRLREALDGHGSEVANSVPTVIRNQPFAKMFNVVGPKGERWVPVHGVLPNSAVMAFHEDLQALLQRHQDSLQRHGVWTGAMFESVGPGAFMYEVGIYWPDALGSYHDMTLSPALRARLPVHGENLEARAWVTAFKKELVALYDAHGATHFQLGKVYPYADLLSPAALGGIRAIKRALDPNERFNPGALGL
jgi:FAD/FMN-containing dehydrogenase